MGLPAEKREHIESRRPHLKVVTPESGSKRGRGRRGTRTASQGRASSGARVTSHAGARDRTHTRAHAAATQAFTFFAVVVALVCVLGMGRVWMSVQAEQASIDSTELQQQIKLERFEGDMLEVRRSALAAPSRIQAVAGSAMSMKSADTVSYLDLRAAPGQRGATVAAAESGPDARTPLGSAVEAALQVVASEASVLLVGDVGLASSR